MANRFSNLSDFDIPESVIDDHEWVADEFIDGPFGHDCTLVYPVTKNQVCPNCFTAGAMVKTIDGFRCIEDIVVGDLVYDGQTYQRVLNTIQTEYHGDFYNFKFAGISPVTEVTPNHEFFVVKDFRKEFKDSQWYDKNFVLDKFGLIKVQAKDLRVEDAVFVPYNIESEEQDLQYVETEFGTIECDDDLLSLIGWWLAEGCLHKSKHIRGGSFCLCASKEKNVAEYLSEMLYNKFNLNAKHEYRADSDNLLVTFYSVKLVKFLQQFGMLAYNKHIPSHLWRTLSLRQKEVVLESYRMGDGNIHTSPVHSIYERYSIVTTSKVLSWQVFDILHNKDSMPSIQYKDSYIDKNGVNHKESWVVTWLPKRKQQKSNFRQCSGGYLSKIVDIDVIHKSDIIYDITVNNTHRFVVNGILSSNCIFDPRAQKSSGIYKTGGPIPFPNHTVCPYCGGVGRSSRAVTENIRLRIYWTMTEFRKSAWFGVDAGDIWIPKGDAIVIGYMTDLPRLEKADHIILNAKVANFRNWKCEREGEAKPWGFRQCRYFVQTLTRVGGG